MHRQHEPQIHEQEFIFQHGPCVESIDGDRHAMEFFCNVFFTKTPGARATWSEWSGGTPEEPPTIEVIRVELLEATLYAMPSLQTGVTLSETDENWRSFKRETEGWLKAAIADDFEASVLNPINKKARRA